MFPVALPSAVCYQGGTPVAALVLSRSDAPVFVAGVRRVGAGVRRGSA